MADSNLREARRQKRKYVLIRMLFTFVGFPIAGILVAISYSYLPHELAFVLFWTLLIGFSVPLYVIWRRKFERPYREWRQRSISDEGSSRESGEDFD